MKRRMVIYLVVVFAMSFLPSPNVCMAMTAPMARGQDGGEIHVFVSILPQAYFVERIGGGHVDVEVLIGEGQSPHTYEPTPQQMAKLASAKAFFIIGVSVERGVMKKVRQLYKNLLIVETQKGITYRYLDGHSHEHDNDSHREEHGLKTPDPHIWMSPKLVKIQARNIYDALCRLDPIHKQEYEKNLRAFLTDLERLDKDIARAFAPLKGRKMYVFHPAFGYFADAYGLIQIPVEIEGKEPSAKQLAELIENSKKDGVKVMFVQPQFSRAIANTVAKAIGGTVVPINPLDRNYLSNLDKIASTVEKGLR